MDAGESVRIKTEESEWVGEGLGKVRESFRLQGRLGKACVELGMNIRMKEVK